MAENVATTGTYTQKEIDDAKPVAAIGYFPLCGLPTFLIPMLANKDNGYAQFHARQGAVLYLGMVALAIVMIIIGVIVGVLESVAGIPGVLSCLISILWLVIGGAGFVLMIIGIINALQGQAKQLPVIGQYASKLPF